MTCSTMSIISDEGRKTVSAHVLPLRIFEYNVQALSVFTQNLNIAEHPFFDELIGIYLDDGLLIATFKRSDFYSCIVKCEKNYKLIRDAIEPVIENGIDRIKSHFDGKADFILELLPIYRLNPLYL